MENDLPPEFQFLFENLVAAPEHVKSIWRYAIALVMIDDEKARIIESRQEGDVLRIVCQTVDGELFEVVRPAMTEEAEQLLLEQLRDMMNENGSDE